MSVQVETLEKNMAKLTVEVTAEEFAKAMTHAYNKNKSQISIPGFRKGKVPQAMVEKMYGPETFYEDAANYLIPLEYEKAAEESGLDIVSTPEVDVVQIEKGKPFIFTAEVAVKPGVALGDYKGIEVEKTEIEVTDEEVDAEIRKAQDQNSREVTVERAAEDKDTVVIDYEGFVDEVAFEGGKGEGHPLVLGSNSFIPGFEEQLVGAVAGSDVDVNVTFPEEYHAKELAGKAAVFKVKVNEVRTKEYPELDDEFAQDVSEFETFEEYKADVKANLLTKKENEAKNKRQQQVMDKVIENASMEIPDPMVTTQANQMMQEYAQRLSYQGLSMEQYFQFTGMTAKDLLEQLKPQALKNIQSRLVLEAVVAAEDIQVSDEELDKEMEEMAKSYGMELDKVKEYMGNAEKENMKKDIAAQKALELVTDSAVEK